MHLWIYWIEAIRSALHLLSSNAGLGVGLGIVGLTLLLRTLTLPMAWSSAYRAHVRKAKLQQLQPELHAIKERYPNDQRKQAELTLELYRKHGLALFDGRALLGSLLQMPVLLGVFQVLRTGVAHTRFLWIADLSLPDIGLAVLAGLTTALVMSMNPDMPEHLRLLMIAVPCVLTILAALKFSSAVALYWTVSNLFSAVQTIVFRQVILRRATAA